ncbi:alpha/beta fold hydrolase [Microvirga flavescens]|uniref:alpha/beta fold hydrolase n=1 Tax=Microvirga flavescens TaxID=2249811 RepID=UPI000DD819C3|nr:alpha/beta hydrolase [Microvirga flavescens]
MLQEADGVQFYPTPDNPIPGEPVLRRVETHDGLALRVACWSPSGPNRKGTVCILQGRAEFIEKYFEVVGELLERGFSVVAFDWRGQGHSARQVGNARKGYVRHFDDYRLDLEAIREHVLAEMPGPHFALAHSMGGAIALNGTYEGWFPFQRLVALAPMVGLSIIKHPRSVQSLAGFLRALGLGKAFVPGGGETSISTMPFKGNRLTTDPIRYARNAHAAVEVGDGAIGSPTVAWLDSAFRFMQRFADPRFALKIHLPVLVVAAGEDPVCATPAIERFAARLKAGHAIVLPGARHEIMMESDAIRAQFWAAFDAFIPGSSDAFDAHPEPVRPSAAEQLHRRRMDAAVAGGDYPATIRR